MDPRPTPDKNSTPESGQQLPREVEMALAAYKTFKETGNEDWLKDAVSLFVYMLQTDEKETDMKSAFNLWVAGERQKVRKYDAMAAIPIIRREIAMFPEVASVLTEMIDTAIKYAGLDKKRSPR